MFIATATAALEYGAMPYAEGVIDNFLNFYVRSDGMIWYRSVEIPATARMLTILAMYYSYSADHDVLLKHFSKAQAAASLLIDRRAEAMKYETTDPRYGIPFGGDECRDGESTSVMNHDELPLHWYASAAEMYRAFTDIGAVWVEIGEQAKRADIIKHGNELLQLAPLLYSDLHASLNRTVGTSAGDRCWQLTAEAGVKQLSFRGFAEMFHSGALTSSQVADIYKAASGAAACGQARFLTMGSPSLGDGKASLSSPSSYGLGFGLLQHDMVERFLLHHFTMSAHAYTRGTFTTPESSNLADRDEPTVAYTAAAVTIAPIYLKWMLCFEEPQTRTLWLAKATPRDWLEVGEGPIAASGLTTRYGRVSFSLQASYDTVQSQGKLQGVYAVRANISLPSSRFGDGTGAVPAGGIRLRLRAPLKIGKLSQVTIGGIAWTAFDATEETIDIASETLKQSGIVARLQSIVAVFNGRRRA